MVVRSRDESQRRAMCAQCRIHSDSLYCTNCIAHRLAAHQKDHTRIASQIDGLKVQLQDRNASPYLCAPDSTPKREKDVIPDPFAYGDGSEAPGPLTSLRLQQQLKAQRCQCDDMRSVVERAHDVTALLQAQIDERRTQIRVRREALQRSHEELLVPSDATLGPRYDKLVALQELLVQQELTAKRLQRYVLILTQRAPAIGQTALAHLPRRPSRSARFELLAVKHRVTTNEHHVSESHTMGSVRPALSQSAQHDHSAPRRYQRCCIPYCCACATIGHLPRPPASVYHQIWTWACILAPF